MIGRRHEAARGCPKANHTGTSRRQNENFFAWAGSPTYPSPGGVRASPLLGAGNTTPFVSQNVLVRSPNSPVRRGAAIRPFRSSVVLLLRVGRVPSELRLGLPRDVQGQAAAQPELPKPLPRGCLCYR